jgi:hypothetical protein
LSPEQIETLVAPIALYPDDLLAVVLPAATYPLDIVKADRFLEKRKANPALKPDPSWPEPVRNLLNYAEVVDKLSDDLDWTSELGEAVVAQQADVMDAIQRFRRKTYSAGNLQTNDKQIVVQEKEIIKIVPADPQVIYVPQYQPTTVIVQQTAPPVAYYPTPYPVYYYPYPPGYAFASGVFFGAATAWAFNWNNDNISNNVTINNTDNININRNNTELDNRAREARERAGTGQASTGPSGGAQNWRSEKQPGQVRTGQASPRSGARPGDAASLGGAQRAQTGAASAQRPGDRGAGDARAGSGGGGDAFSGYGSRRETASASNRGSQSRASTSSEFGGRSGGGGRAGGGGGRAGGGGGGGRR